MEAASRFLKMAKEVQQDDPRLAEAYIAMAAEAAKRYYEEWYRKGTAM